MIRTFDENGMTSRVVPLMKDRGHWETQRETLARGKKLNACTNCRVVSADKCKRCARCTSAWARYCGRECQRAHWSKHKKVCGTKHPCPLCMERADTDGNHVMCFECGFFACETCQFPGYCPGCGSEDGAEAGRKTLVLRNLLAAKPTGRHVSKALYWLGKYFLKGEEGVPMVPDLAMGFFELSIYEGCATAGVEFFNVCSAIGQVDSGLPFLARALSMPGNDLNARSRQSCEDCARTHMVAAEFRGTLDEFLAAKDTLPVQSIMAHSSVLERLLAAWDERCPAAATASAAPTPATAT